MTHPAILTARIARVIEGTRVNITNERLAHDAIAAALARDGLDVRREVVLTDKERIDIMVEGVGIEVKVQHSKREIFAQLTRYAKLEAVTALVLATGRAWPASMREIEGKPFRSVSLSRGWL